MEPSVGWLVDVGPLALAESVKALNVAKVDASISTSAAVAWNDELDVEVEPFFPFLCNQTRQTMWHTVLTTRTWSQNSTV